MYRVFDARNMAVFSPQDKSRTGESPGLSRAWAYAGAYASVGSW